MDKIIDQVKAYYATKIATFGSTAQGVDWNSIESQELRFEILSNVINEPRNFSILDWGCGFGSMYGYYKQKYQDFTYYGFDIAEPMIAEAVLKFAPNESLIWSTILPQGSSDYVIASGIFNVKLENSAEDWLQYILKTLNTMDKFSTKGFAFNVLTKYSDQEYMKDYLYYADPLFLFDYCKKHFSKNVALLHDYDLYEFSIIVRK